VPLRQVVWLARPRANVRRVYYDGFHNNDPRQRFIRSLTMSRVLEDPPGELPASTTPPPDVTGGRPRRPGALRKRKRRFLLRLGRE